MEVAECISLLPQFFQSFFSTYIDLLHLLSLNQSFWFLSLHFILGRPCSHFSSTSGTIAFIKTSSSGRLKTRPYYVTPFALASLSAASFNPNIFISSTAFFLSINFTLHIALTIDLSALLKIVTSFFLNTRFVSI